MAQLMLHKDVLKGFSKLPVKVQKKLAEFVEKFQEDPYDPSLGLHKLEETMADPKGRGADLAGDYRAIIVAPEQGDTFLLVHIGMHDSSYRWAKKKHFEVHSKTGLFQIYDVEEVSTAIEEQPEEPDKYIDYPLKNMSDDDLYLAGVPQALIPSVRDIKSDHELEVLGDYLPPDCRDVLVGIASGMSLDESIEEMLGTPQKVLAETSPEGPGDFTNIQTIPNFDLVLVEGEEHLKDILQASLDVWRIFLHPYQRKIVEWDVNGPMNITGAAGTGKTVALMHRAVYLARKLADPKARILVTTFTTTLSITIKHHLSRLGPDVANRIEVTNLHALARTICNRAGWRGRIADENDLKEIWGEEVWKNTAIGELPLSREEMLKEFNLIIEPNGIDSEDDYITTIRSGRTRLGRKQRRRAWPIFLAVKRGLKKRNLLTFEGAIHHARLCVEQGNFSKYTHVLVDEIQDFSLEALRLIKSLSSIGEGNSNPLCTVGDGHQRIFRTKIPLSRAGINIRGRSRRLKINYRTSEQIRKFAHTILEGLEIDDLDNGVISTIGDHSAFKGPEPIIEPCENKKTEAQYIVNWIKKLTKEHNLSTEEICITPPTPEIVASQSAANTPLYQLKPKEKDPGANEPGVRLGSMKRIKGLEFRAIAMACSDPEDPMNDLKNATLLQRCERYVAATRAREFLLITVGK